VAEVYAMMHDECRLAALLIEEVVGCHTRERQLFLTSTWMMQPKMSEQRLKDLTEAVKLELTAS
jgi:hypothetical protein